MTNPNQINGNEGKLMARRPTGPHTMLVLNLPNHEIAGLRGIADSINLHGTRKPSLSLIARRAMQLFVHHYGQNPQHEEAALVALGTKVPSPMAEKYKKAGTSTRVAVKKPSGAAVQ